MKCAAMRAQSSSCGNRLYRQKLVLVVEEAQTVRLLAEYASAEDIVRPGAAVEPLAM